MKVVVQAERRLDQAVELRSLRQAGELQEELVHVLADLVIAGEEAIVGVLPGGPRMIVAGAEVAVAADAARLAADHHRELCMRLVADDTVHDVRAGLLQAVRQLDVGFLVEPRAQLDDHRDVLAGVCRGDQRIHDGRVVARAIERLLDGEYVGIVGRLPQEVHHRREALIGMVQQQVFLADDGEEVGAGHQSLGQARCEDRIFEVRAAARGRTRRSAD